jgi:esterase
MELYYRKYGSGPPLFILHGLYGSSDNWVTIARKLSEYFTVYLPDQRNHGQSPHSDLHDYDSMSQDLFDMTERLELTKIFLAGHSMGGKVAVNFALKWPEKINSLVIIDVSPFSLPDTESTFYNENRIILEAILSADLSGVKTRTEVEKLLEKKIVSDKTRGLILKNIKRNEDLVFEWKINPVSLYKNLKNMVSGLPRPSNETEPVTGFPVTVIKGENSSYLPSGEFEEIKKLFPSAELAIIKNSGHWVHADQPEEIAEILLNQLKDLDVFQ